MHLRKLSYILVYEMIRITVFNKKYLMNKSNNYPQPTDAELEILQILWKHGPSTVRFVNETLNGQVIDKKIGYTTTLKLMQIMTTDKGLLSRNTDTRTHIYKAEAPQADTKKALTQRFMEATFNGSAMDLVMHALGNSQTSQSDLDEIKALIEKIENQK